MENMDRQALRQYRKNLEIFELIYRWRWYYYLAFLLQAALLIYIFDFNKLITALAIVWILYGGFQQDSFLSHINKHKDDPKKVAKPFKEANILMLIWLVFIFLMIFGGNFSYYFFDFDISKNQLKYTQGVVVSNGEAADNITVQIDGENYDFTFYNSHNMPTQKLKIPTHENVEILYTVAKMSSGKRTNRYLLTYDIRSENHVYMDYSQQKQYYLSVQQRLKRKIKSTVVLFSLLAVCTWGIFCILVQRKSL